MGMHTLQACMAPSLSNKNEYPLVRGTLGLVHSNEFCKGRVCLQFSRTVAPETAKGPALVALMRHYKWAMVVILTSTDGVWRESARGLSERLQEAGMKVLRPKPFDPGTFTTQILKEFKSSGIRVVMVMAYDEDVEAVASSAATEQMTSAGWAWIFGALDVATVHVQGWLCMREVLPSADALRAFAGQVKDYTRLHFNSTAALCLDRNDTSEYGTTCAQSLLYCKQWGINWFDPGHNYIGP